MGALSVRLPESLHDRVRQLADEEGISMNQLVMLAVAEKMARLDAGAQSAYIEALRSLEVGHVGLEFRGGAEVSDEALWRQILADDYVRVVKVAAEEFIELGAYLLMAAGTLEFLYAWSRLPRRRKRQGR